MRSALLKSYVKRGKDGGGQEAQHAIVRASLGLREQNRGGHVEEDGYWSKWGTPGTGDY